MRGISHGKFPREVPPGNPAGSSRGTSRGEFLPRDFPREVTAGSYRGKSRGKLPRDFPQDVLPRDLPAASSRRKFPREIPREVPVGFGAPASTVRKMIGLKKRSNNRHPQPTAELPTVTFGHAAMTLAYVGSPPLAPNFNVGEFEKAGGLQI